MRYKVFFQIEIEHQYFSPGESAELVIIPDSPTRHFLNGSRIIIKEMRNGIQLLVLVDEQDSVLPILKANDSFIFKVFPVSSAFHAFTAMPDLATGEVLNFTNTGLLENETQLASSIANDSGVLNGFPIVANVAIQVGNLLLDSNNTPTAPKYKMAFNSKATPWKYYIVSDPDMITTDLSIQDANQDINEQLTFNNTNIEDNTEDKIIAALQSNFPDANVSLFESQAPVPSRSQAIKNLQLLRHDADNPNTTDIIINHLPNPDTKDIDFKIINIYK